MIADALLAAAIATQPLSLRNWIGANEQAIVRMSDRKRRVLAQRAFAAALAGLTKEKGVMIRSVPRQDPRRLARSILNPRLYRFLAPDQPPRRTWWARLLDWLSQRWTRLMHVIFGRAALPAQVNRRIADGLLALSILVFLALLMRVFWLYARRRDVKLCAVPIPMPERASELLASSMNEARAGRYAIAIARLFAAAIALLTLKKRFDGRSSDTAAEMSRRVASSDAGLREPFDQLTYHLTNAVYAERPVSASDWAQSLDAYHRLEVMLQT